MAENRVFVSPGVFTSERDLTFVTRKVGVTTLGLAGETTKGPAFQPIFINNFDEFRRFFGGLNATKIKENGAPKYELPYIAKSYLSESNQLFVTRTLGLSGYDAGKAWAVTLDAAMDSTTTATTAGPTSEATLITFSANSAGVLLSVTSSNALLQSLYAAGDLDAQLAFLPTSITGTTATITPTYLKVTEAGSIFSGLSASLEVTAKGLNGTDITGTTSGITTEYSGLSYTGVENTVVAVLRSRAAYDGLETLNFQVTGTNIGFDSTITTGLDNPKGAFALSGISNTTGVFNYELSFNSSNKNYISKVLGTAANDSKTAVFVDEVYQTMLDQYTTDGKIRGINNTLVTYDTGYNNNKKIFNEAQSPWVTSEVRGTNLFRLFKFWTISDGDTANREIKISFINIKPDNKTFDLVIRNFYDTDAKPSVLEKYAGLSMDPASNNFIGKKVGTKDGLYPSKSSYVLVEMAEGADDPTISNVKTSFPSGFEGMPQRDVNGSAADSNTGIERPVIRYKESYGAFENKRKFYLGVSNTVGIDESFLEFKGIPNSTSFNQWTATTKGFHMDIAASASTIDGVAIPIDTTGGTFSPIFEFDTGVAEFRTDAGLIGGPYEKIEARKFTMVCYGGFDGWDIYRTRRTNEDTYAINGTKGILGTPTNFSNIALANGDTGINSDYYAYLEAIRTFNNPEAVNINVFATPGIDTRDNSNLVEETIEMIEQERADSLYITTLPDTDSSGVTPITPSDAVGIMDDKYDSNYTATYFPWVQINDTENNVYMFVPPTRDVVRNIALTDNIKFPWFAVAGIERGDVKAIKARIKLTQTQRDTLYAGRINPVATWSTEGVKIWGNKNLQVNETQLNRINVRRLLLQTRKLVSAVSIKLLFEQNDDVVRKQFLGLVNPILENIRASRGLSDFRVELDDSPESRDRNELIGRIFIKPVTALEFIEVEFVLTPTGASFDDI